MTCTLHTSSFKRSLAWGVSLLLGVASWSLAARTVSPLPADLADLTRYRNFVGTPLYFRVTAPTSGSGSLWGTQIYSDDSSLAKAALHAGVLQAGQTGVVKVTPLGPQSSFTGSTAYGVTSSGAGSYSGSYKIEADDDGNNPVLPDPVNLLGYRNAIGGVYLFSVKGTATYSVWGSNTYSDDSPLSHTAVHMGVLGNGETGTVRVVITPGLTTYVSNTRYGISSREYSNYGGSYTVNRVDGSASLAAYPGMKENPLPEPGSMSAYSSPSRVGAGLYFSVTGNTSGSLWGTGIYTSDSTFAKAVVHTGLLSVGQTGVIQTLMLNGQSNYIGSTAYGVSSNSYASYGSSYQLGLGDGTMGAIPMVQSAATASAKVGESFQFSFSASPGATHFEANGLPEGLSHSNGAISGTPRISGSFPIDLIATNSTGSSSKTLMLSIQSATDTPITPNNPNTSSAQSLFSWAEHAFPSLFAPAGQSTQNLFGYTLRYYPGTQTYLGIAQNRVYMYGPATGFTLLDVGSLQDLAGLAKANGF